MAVPKKLTRLARIGVTHGEKAKSLAARGLFREALSELKIALFSLRGENADGRLNDEIASVLHNIGTVNMMLNKFADAQTAFEDSIAIRRPMTNNPEIAGSLIGLSEASRGICDYERSGESLEEAMQIALSQKNDALALRVIIAADQLERTRYNMPSADSPTQNDCHIQSAFTGTEVILRNIEMTVTVNAIELILVMGFPNLDSRAIKKSLNNAPEIPCIGIFFIENPGNVRSISVVDEEESAVPSSIEKFEGAIFAPDSYHKSGPKPTPYCKKLIFTGGSGALLKWELSPNGWYRAKIQLVTPGAEERSRLMLAVPFYVRISTITVDIKKPLIHGQLCIDEGTFHTTRNPEHTRIGGSSLPYAFKRRLFDGSASGRICIPVGSSAKYAVIAFDLSPSR
ncbi:MAG TPA: tetratricopeptide repeat protein [Methanocella sp.]|nr:tetratricopeptide repeat protein [Methanocella sp.]